MNALGDIHCYCQHDAAGVWDARGILHGTDACRYTDRLITVGYAYKEDTDEEP